MKYFKFYKELELVYIKNNLIKSSIMFEEALPFLIKSGLKSGLKYYSMVVLPW